MERTLTIRLDRRQDQALAKRARTLGKTKSAVVRDLIDAGLEVRSVERRAGHLKGRVVLPRQPGHWRASLRERNWR